MRITGSRRSTSGREVADGGVQGLAAAGERVAELGQVDLDRGAGGVVEGVEDLVDLDRLGGGRAERHRVAGLEALLGGAALDLQVLEAQGRARAHDHGRVDRQRVEVLVQLHVDLGVDRAVLRVLDRLDGLDRADADAADADLVAGDQRVGVGHLGRELVGGDEGQALVRLVGEEDRDGDDEHGDGADQGRAGGEAARAPAPHDEPPEQELQQQRGLAHRDVRRRRRRRRASADAGARRPPHPEGSGSVGRGRSGSVGVVSVGSSPSGSSSGMTSSTGGSGLLGAPGARPEPPGLTRRPCPSSSSSSSSSSTASSLEEERLAARARPRPENVQAVASAWPVARWKWPNWS